jgi:hypothetical protein
MPSTPAMTPGIAIDSRVTPDSGVPSASDRHESEVV